MHKIMTLFAPRSLLVTLVLLTVVAGCKKSAEKESKPANQDPLNVRVALVESRVMPQSIKIQGSLMGDEHAVVGVKVAGRVQTVAIDIGSVVKRGDVLATLEAEEFQIKIKQAQAEEESIRAKLGLKPGDDASKMDRAAAPTVLQEKAQMDGAQKAYNRALRLEESAAISDEEMQVYRTALKVAQARYLASLHTIDEQIANLHEKVNALALARQALADATMTAPFDGIVAVRHVAPGVYLQVGDHVVDLVRVNPLRFHGGVPERHSLRVAPGQEVKIKIEGREKPLIGKVTRVSPMLNLASRSLPIEIDVPNADLSLKAGLFAEAEIIINPKAQVLTVPDSSVIEFAGVQKVCVVEKDTAILRKIVTGRHIGDRVEVIDGLQASEQVVIDGKTARPGPVAIQSAPPRATKGPDLAITDRPIR